MKGVNALEMGTILFLFSVIVSVQCQEQSNYNGTCGPNTHCPTNKGLICDMGLCKCGSGLATQTLQYLMTWDSTLEECVAKENGVCIGTSKNPVAGEMKSIKCEGQLTCVQVDALPLGQGVCTNLGHGTDCDQNNYCDSALGLICSQGKCACGGGPVNHEYSFNMEWESGRGLCLSNIGGACVGTETNPVAENMKNVECVTGECVQIEALPPGIGVCTSDSSTTTTTPNPGSSTDSNTTPSGADSRSVTAPTFAITLAIIFRCLF